MTAVPESLAAALQGFARDPARAGKVLRQALDADGGGFLRSIILNPVFDINDRGFRYAIVLLRNSDLLAPAVASPSVTTFAQALALTRCVLALDSNFINHLIDGLSSRQDLRDPACILRVLDLVGECGDSVSNWRPLMRMYEGGNHKARARCAALLTRFRFDSAGAATRFEDSDPRVRAGIVEALWEKTLRDPPPREGNKGKHAGLLEQALTDPNNRVAGNACFALYNTGDARALTCLAKLLHRDSPEFQMTAAWVMGRTRDVRFASCLAAAGRSGPPDLRKSAFRGLACLEPFGAEPDPAVPRPVAASVLAEVEHWEFWLRAVDPENRFVRGLRPTDFFLFGEDDPVLDYSVEKRCAAASSSVAIVYPAGNRELEQTLRSAVPAKPRSQKWAFSAYGTDIRPFQQTAIPEYFHDGSRLTESLGAGAPGTLSAGRSCRSILRLESGGAEQHLLVLFDGTACDVEFASIRAQCRERRISLHCWRTADFNSADILLNSRVPLLPEPGFSLWWADFAASLQECYVVRCEGAPRPDTCRLRDATKTPARFSQAAPLFGARKGQ